MKLKKLLESIPEVEVHGSKEIEITGLCSHSKQVAPGHLFIARKGAALDGAQFLEEAKAGGAVCVLTDLYDPFLEITQIIHPHPAQLEAELGDKFYRAPSKELYMVGITGTNGKTTCSYLIKHIFDHLGKKTGLIGTNEWIVGDHRIPSFMTTPDSITNQKLLREMHISDCASAVMEVSSHGLDQNRVDKIDFDCALFTNLTQDHLDYHKTFEKYKMAKGELFLKLSPKAYAVFNSDDPTFYPTAAKTLTYGIKNPADLMAHDLKFRSGKSHFSVTYKGEEQACILPQIGIFNVYNALGALSVAVCAGLPLSGAIAALRNFKQVPGRLQRVANKLKIEVYVDYAHTPDALERVLEALTVIKKGRIITVFGCGGDRDPSKRKAMGQVAEKLSDKVIITTDNPRFEDPEEIARCILEGFDRDYPVVVELDRRNAIGKALDLAQEKDTILIAGKGHEKEQLVAGSTRVFCDIEIARILCREREKSCV